jgi:two-component system, LytTR family, response regulator
MNRKTQTPASPPRFRVILVDDEHTARVQLTNRLKSHPELEIVGEAEDVNSANDLVQTLKPELIFLDIQMPKMNGFDLLPKLENLTPQPAVVFVTAYDEYAIRAFEANALDYLTKPVSAERLAKTILRLSKPPVSEAVMSHPVATTRERLRAEDLVLLRDKSLTMMVKAGEIIAIEAHGDYARVLLNEGQNLMIKQTLSHWEGQLPAGLFMKVSRRLLVNTQSVAKMVKRNLLTWELQLQGAKEPLLLSNLESKRLRAVL